ncbi:hypothetical protein [Streptomyces sp. NPDC007088]|uniref:hypothetical protein n=1 Tax=Streptomyces sp. NPDC007088 TaxID=3364773 RepID=UPI0036ABF274
MRPPEEPRGPPLQHRTRTHRRLVRDLPPPPPAQPALQRTRHPDIARSHDRRITALTQYYEAARNRRVIQHAPDLTALRSGVDRDATAPQRLTPRERAIFLAVVGSWNSNHTIAPERDRLLAYLLLSRLRLPLRSRFPNELVRAMADTHPLLAQRTPPVTADTIAHTGLWDEPEAG